MTEKELHRSHIIQQVNDKLITQLKAAEILHISVRQIRNLLRKIKQEGAQGLISKKRGVRSNRSLSFDLRSNIISLLQERYDDFGPTLATEKLKEEHEIRVSIETVRKIMIEIGLHIPKRSKSKAHQLRARRENFGELMQTDASTHYWLEERGEKCALSIIIDDATSKITSAHFTRTECLEGYFIIFKKHLLKYGRPLAIYSDRHAIFGGADIIQQAQLIRAFNELGIESILAKSPQAKGRVERAFATLQDRLIKEMRLRGIASIEEANVFLEEYIEKHNAKFSKEPRGQINPHRPLDSRYNLDYILARREERTVSKDLSISFYNRRIKILEPNMLNRLKGKKVNMIQRQEGGIEIYYQGKLLKSAPAEEVLRQQEVLDYKEIACWKPKKSHKPAPNHPWRKYDRGNLFGNQDGLKKRNIV